MRTMAIEAIASLEKIASKYQAGKAIAERIYDQVGQAATARAITRAEGAAIGEGFWSRMDNRVNDVWRQLETGERGMARKVGLKYPRALVASKTPEGIRGMRDQLKKRLQAVDIRDGKDPRRSVSDYNFYMPDPR